MKLLDKTIRSYLFYALVVVLVAIPVFYLVVDRVLLVSVDHSLWHQLRDIRSNVASIHSIEELQAWAKMDKDISLNPAPPGVKDQLYTVYRPNRRGEQVPIREVRAGLEVQGHSYALVISNSLVETEDLLGSIVLVQAGLLVGLMAGLLWINRRISQRIWKPFYGSLEGMKKYKLNRHTSPEAAATGIQEFDELNAAIKQLIDRNYQVYQAQKAFTENASHEMQTPLAVLQSKTELLMQTEPLTETQADLIGTLEEVNRRLSRLHRSLLLLTSIENHQYAGAERVEVGALLRTLVEQYQDMAASKSIHIEVQGALSCWVEANPALLEIMLSNLIGNALRHNVPGGWVQIRLGEDQVLLANSGAAEPLPKDKIFSRFYKSGADSHSLGLGLAIVKKITEVCGFDIEYRWQDGLHQFLIHFHSKDPVHG